jgi:hypothetical protein
MLPTCQSHCRLLHFRIYCASFKGAWCALWMSWSWRRTSGVASGWGEGSAVSSLNSSDDDSNNDDPDRENTGVDGDVNGDDADDFNIINEVSLGDIIIPVAKIMNHDRKNVGLLLFFAYNYAPPLGPHGEIF